MPESPPRLTRVLETVLYYTDAEATQRFYTDVLGLRLLDVEPGRSIFYRLGDSVLLLFKADETLQGRTLPPHGATGPIHTCFQVLPDEYERWKAHLASHDVPVIHETRWPKGLSFYFHDPHGNLLEIANEDIWPG
jgi:catechol 2,3-dioxygenase-like lactoylglutathione lyase family enzyme